MIRIALISLIVAALCGARVARADTEWVLMLDNSTSMIRESTWSITETDITGKVTKREGTSQANDPDRLAIIATLVFRALAGSEDKLTILTYKSAERNPDGSTKRKLWGEHRQLDTIDDVRNLRFTEATFMVGPFTRGREILKASTAKNKIFLLATDGTPNPEPDDAPQMDAKGARTLLELDPGPPPFEVVSLALSKDKPGQEIQESFLKPLGKYYPVNDPFNLIAAFTEVFAQSIRSRPETGTLDSGKSYDFRVGKYVSDVYVAVASEGKTGPFTAQVKADGKALVPLDSGDSGCTPKPCYAYQVFKTPHDPKVDSKFSLSIPAGAGKVAYGIIMKYELAAEIISGPSKAKAGEQIEVVARINWQGNTFNDPAFFKADGFKAELVLDDVTVPLTPKDDGTFVAKITVGGVPRSTKLEARFSNQWIKMVGERELVVDEWLPLDLKVGTIDFGSWTGARAKTKQCLDIDLAGSTNADKVPLEVLATGLKDGYALEVGKPAVVKNNKLHACIVAPGCCAPSPKDVSLTIRGADPHYHPGAVQQPAKLAVAPTSFLNCYWPFIAAAIGTVLLLIIVVGFVKPRDFDKEDLIRLAKTEQALTRAGGRRLRDLPGGKRGFYRDAHVAFDGAGNAVRATKGVTMVLRAAKGDPQVQIFGGLEEKDPRTRKFVQVDLAKGPIYLRRGIVYKSGEFVFRVG